MKKKYRKFGLIIILVTVLLSVVFYIDFINTARLSLLDSTLDQQAYTFVSKDKLLEKVDRKLSNYEKLNIYIKNDDNKEFDVNVDLESIYESFDLEIQDRNLIPLGKDVRVRFEAIKSKSSAEIIIEKSLKQQVMIKVFDIKNKELQTDASFTISNEDELRDILNLNARIFKFGEFGEEVVLKIDHSIDVNKNGRYDVSLTDDSYNFKQEFEVIVKKPVAVIIENKQKDIPKQNEVINPDNSKQVNSLDRIDVLVNKEYHLKADTIPPLKSFLNQYAIGDGYLAQPAVVDSFIRLVDTMQAETKMRIFVASAYRSYAYQEGLFNRYAKRDGIVAANRYSARAGQSEHQTGLAIDVTTSGGSMLLFGNTQESVWIAKNSHRFGFIVRYPLGKEYITGYQYEPWHLRYLGEDLALKVVTSGLTYDEYWKLNLQ